MRRTLIAGGAGSIGSELVRQLSRTRKVFVVDINETGVVDLCEELQLKGLWVYGRVTDVCDKDAMESVFSDFRPHEVINASAYKHVKAMEYAPEQAVRVNIGGNLTLIEAAKRWKTKKYCFISTDKAASAHSVMGATKRCSEIITRNQGKGFVVVRFANVLGSRGSAIPFWQNQLDRGDPVTVTDERMERFFMSIEDACASVIEAMKYDSGTVILDMGKRVNVLEMAKRITAEANGTIRMIGMRPGETLTEELMTEEEKKRAIKHGKFWHIPV